LSSYKRGVVSAVDVDAVKARVKFPDKGDVESYWLEVLQRNAGANKDKCLPDVGELVAVMLDDKGESGCILGAFYAGENKPPDTGQDARRIEFGDGCTVTYDRSTSTLTIEGAIKVEVLGDTLVDIGGITKIGDGASAVALADKVATELNVLKSVIGGAAVTPGDGGAAFKAGIVGGLGSWPGDLSAEKLSSD